MNVNGCKNCGELYYSNSKHNGIHYHYVYGLCLKCIHLWVKIEKGDSIWSALTVKVKKHAQYIPQGMFKKSVKYVAGNLAQLKSPPKLWGFSNESKI